METEGMNATPSGEQKAEVELPEPTAFPNDTPTSEATGVTSVSGHIVGGAIVTESFTTLAYLLPFASAAAGATVTMVVTWLRQRRSNVTVEVTDNDGRTFKVEGTRLLDPGGYTQDVLERIDKASEMRILAPKDKEEKQKTRNTKRPRHQ